MNSLFIILLTCYYDVFVVVGDGVKCAHSDVRIPGLYRVEDALLIACTVADNIIWCTGHHLAQERWNVIREDKVTETHFRWICEKTLCLYDLPCESI